MKLSLYQLDQHLAKTLAPIYFISGDETLLVQEAADAVRSAARARGYDERQTLTLEPRMDWAKLFFANAHSLSLFASKRIVELHLGTAKPNAASNEILLEMVSQPLNDTILLITANKLDTKITQTKWYKTIDKVGVTMPIWPPFSDQLSNWVMQRAKKKGVVLAPEAAKLLAEQAEGNLLAAAQEIEKLSLLNEGKVFAASEVLAAISDNAHFDIFGLVDAALMGNTERALRIIKNLAAEDTEPLIVLWGLTRELRTLAQIAFQIKQGESFTALCSKYRIWDKRQPYVKTFLQRHSLPSCWKMLQNAGEIDQVIKGAKPGDAWLALQRLTLQMTCRRDEVIF